MKDVTHTLLAGCLVAAACSASPAAFNQREGEAVQLPAGAKMERSGFWTIAMSPDSPVPPRTPPPERKLTIYAEIAGVSNEEAQKRLDEQNAIRPEFERLMATLRTKERGNYTDAELIHRPDWAYRIYFKRNPETTLAKYTKNPRFQARSSAYTEEELQKLSKTWIDRLVAERLTTGYGMNARHGTADVDMVVSKEEFEAIARRNGWGEPPAFLNLKFDTAPVGPAVASAVAAGIRIFPQSDRNLGATNQAALGGHIILRDGCFLVIGHDGSEKLAYFAREVGLGIYGEGYLSLYSRTGERRHLGRVGERFTWAGPIHIDDSAPMVKELRAQCGNTPLMHVGIPESAAIFNARYGLPNPQPPHRTGAARPEPVIQPGISEPPPVPLIDSRPPPAPPPPPKPPLVATVPG